MEIPVVLPHRRSFFLRFKWAVALIIACLLVSLLQSLKLQLEPLTISFYNTTGINQFVSNLFLSAALAIAIAIVTTEIVEKSSLKRLQTEHERFEARAKTITEASTRAVALNLWGEDHAVEVLQEILASNFTSHLLRQNYIVDCTFEKIKGTNKAVMLKNIVEYTTINPAKRIETFEPVFAADDTSKLYPNHPHIRPPTLTSVMIGNKTFSKAQLNRVNRSMYPKRASSALKGPSASLGRYDIHPNQEIKVRLTYESVVPVDNQWIQAVGVPTKGLRVAVHNRVGLDFAVHIAPLFRSDFSKAEPLSSDGRDWERSYDGVILPQSGWTTRWNRVSTPTLKAKGVR